MSRSDRRRAVAAAAIACLGAGALIGGNSGPVLASWQDSNWGAATFGVDPDYVPVGYARARSSNAFIDRLITSGEFPGAQALRDQTARGTTATGWQSFSSSGFLGLFNISAEGNSCASYYSADATSCRPELGVNDASASSQMRNLVVRNTALSGNSVETTGVFSTSALCPADGSPPQAGPLTGGTLRVLNSTVAIPGPNASTPINVTGLLRSYVGTLTHVQTTTGTSAVSRLRLQLEERLLLGLVPQWRMDMNVLSADCAIGSAPGPLASIAGPMPMSPEQVMTADEVSIESDTDSGPAESGAGEPGAGEPGAGDTENGESEAAESGGAPAGPVSVVFGRPFDIHDADGTRVATGTVDDASWDSTSRLAVRMRVEDVVEQLAAPEAADFRAVSEGVGRKVGAADLGDRNGFPSRLRPGLDYDGWVGMDVGAGPASAMLWHPEGTPGWYFTLPPVSPPAGTGPPVSTGAPAAPPPTEPPPAEPPVATVVPTTTETPTAEPAPPVEPVASDQATPATSTTTTTTRSPRRRLRTG
ncbi:hypothetical protein G4H71_13410 [Rhodococcus triatomae]|uniref:Uncharacterized protein n=1 Tax=Rhodococcus triatomae TaxID=300028 RepID=A0A1G8H665_9NOCA|nr:hypothetical protein [Rhodococcus triatomae]QNG20197.1 hypothetical protein G4H72_16970 [Rhodococcus triatomae]QNG23888.1 hypothetical protein G4H71_13410 [Rhodococcus triatomae]SDI02049.1 hypothetical protein SAMN05444695_104327 [Rhodococcus triatomae]